jgi:hypothetical protein
VERGREREAEGTARRRGVSAAGERRESAGRACLCASLDLVVREEGDVLLAVGKRPLAGRHFHLLGSAHVGALVGNLHEEHRDGEGDGKKDAAVNERSGGERREFLVVNERCGREGGHEYARKEGDGEV